GPIKDKEVFIGILRAGGYLNLDSHDELAWLAELSQNYPNEQFRVGLRVNFDIASVCPQEEMASEEGGRFGYCYENGVLEQTIRQIERLSNVTIAGLHLHTSTQSRSVRVYEELAGMAVKIASEFQLRLSYVDMGGGYFGGRSDKPGYKEYFQAIGARLAQCFSPAETRLIVEPGISLISRAITFETVVKDIKDIRDHKFVVTDGSRVNLNPLVTRHFYPHHIVYQDDGPSDDRAIEASQWVCGFTCMEYDRLFEIKEGKGLRCGDRIIYDTAGGYTMGLTPLFINYFPAVIVEQAAGDFFVAREAWGNDEYLQKNHY
ncbi:MAG: pyridoxal-dependent decarboxylase, partial [Lachnospiraceae bacterium]|nr:pyridoxal-dependent decarboxylase [Lachnospiraceae bacterium]